MECSIEVPPSNAPSSECSIECPTTLVIPRSRTAGGRARQEMDEYRSAQLKKDAEMMAKYESLVAQVHPLL